MASILEKNYNFTVDSDVNCCCHRDDHCFGH